MLHPYQINFIEFALENNALQFGSFVLKSGRISPYFFNAGYFKTGLAFSKLSHFYADAIVAHFKPEEYSVLFGPAYKGIALATAASMGLYLHHRHNIPVAFNRKETKDHGEGGRVIGETLTQKKVLVVDDVVTAGTTLQEVSELVKHEQAHFVGAVICLDRQEKGLNSEASAIASAEKEFGIKIRSIITLDDLITYLNLQAPDSVLKAHLDAVLEYRTLYGTPYKKEAPQ